MGSFEIKIKVKNFLNLGPETPLPLKVKNDYNFFFSDDLKDIFCRRKKIPWKTWKIPQIWSILWILFKFWWSEFPLWWNCIYSNKFQVQVYDLEMTWTQGWQYLEIVMVLSWFFLLLKVWRRHVLQSFSIVCILHWRLNSTMMSGK